MNPLDVIDGGNLRKWIKRPLRVEMTEVLSGKIYSGEIFIISPVGLGIRSEAPWNATYRITLSPSLEVVVRGIYGRESQGIHGYDVLETFRDGKREASRLTQDEYLYLTGSQEQLVDLICEGIPENVREIARKRLQETVEKARIFDELKVGEVWSYHDDHIRPLTKMNLDIDKEMLAHLMREAIQKNGPRREIIMEKDRYYDIHCLPMSTRQGGILALDVTEIYEREQRMKKREQQIYREVIMAVTRGRLVLVDEDEAGNLLKEGELLFTGRIDNPDDLRLAREEVRGVLSAFPFNPKQTYNLLLSFSEAMTNVLKHAEKGQYQVRRVNQALRFCVMDDGPGIPLDELPKAALMDRYSSKDSMGSGFTIMLHILDRIFLRTSSWGTILVLEKGIEEQSKGKWQVDGVTIP